MNWKDYLNFLKLLISHITKIFVIILLLQAISFAQEDTVKNQDEKPADTVFVMHKSPWGAVLRSAILPGWGQIYNESYIKAPIVLGIFGSLAAVWIWNNHKYNDAKYLYSQNMNNPDPYVVNAYRNYRDAYRDQRDLVSIYIGLAYFLNLVDAYVDAELFDFNVQSNQSGQNMLNLRIKF
jgi:hypothetical protein